MNNARIIDKLAMVCLDVSIWGARARLNRSDLKDTSSLPPKAMATLGSKKLFDPTKLRVFNTLKASAVRVLDRHGTRFLGGWATDVDKLNTIEHELENIAADFRIKADKFFDGYEDGVKDWAINFPGYEHVLLNAVPSLNALKRKFNFSWQTFKITPIESIYGGNDLNNVIDSLDRTALQEVAAVIKDIYENTFKGKTTVTRKQFRPFNALFDKLQALSFIHPYFDGLKSLLQTIVNGYKDQCNDPRFVAVFTALLASMSTVDGVKAVVEPYNMGQITATDTLMSFDIVPPAPAAETLPEDGFDVFSDDADDTPAPLVPPVQTADDNMLDNGGLW